MTTPTPPLLPLLKMPGKKTEALLFRMSPETSVLLEKLAKTHGTTRTAILESLIVEESKRFGLIEAR